MLIYGEVERHNRNNITMAAKTTMRWVLSCFFSVVLVVEVK